MRSHFQGSVRTTTGSMTALIFIVLIPVCFGIGAFAVDFAHYDAVKTALQRATDAAALAGAADLIADPNNVENHALSVASDNKADGKSVSNSTPHTSVIVETTPCTDTAVGTCTVTASMEIRNMFAAIIGRPTDTITTSSVAGTYGTLTQIAADTAFPLAVSIDTVLNGPGNSNGNGNGGNNGNGH